MKPFPCNFYFGFLSGTKQLSLTFSKAAIALTILSALPANAADLDFKSIYSFGDSLSDTGNVYRFSKAQSPLNAFPPKPFYSKGRFSNGSIWVDYIAKDLGIEQKTFAKITLSGDSSIPEGGVNFAFGGATTGDTNLGDDIGGGAFLGLSEQIGAYTNLLGDRSADSEALYTIWAGTNDYVSLLSSSGQDIPSQISQTVNNLATSITTLADKGARNIVVFNLPSLGKTPLGASIPGVNPEDLNTLTAIHNEALAGAVENLNNSQPFQDTNTKVVLFDVNSLFNAVIENPQASGFGNVTDNCTGIDFPNVNFVGDFPGWLHCTGKLYKDPKAFLFYDNQHPTTSAHELVADSVLDTLESAFGDDYSYYSQISDTSSRVSATSAIIKQSESASVPEPSSVYVFGAVGFLFLGTMFQKRSVS
jgi:phospholipase/lecithinase/hemolysin